SGDTLSDGRFARGSSSDFAGWFAHRVRFERRSARHKSRWQLRDIFVRRRQADSNHKHFAGKLIRPSYQRKLPAEYFRRWKVHRVLVESRSRFPKRRGNLELFVYDTTASTFSQLTNSSGIVGFTDAKISGDGSTV